MRKHIKRIWLLLSGAAMMFLTAVPAFADEIYEPPMPGDYRNVVPWMIVIAAVVIGVQLITGIVLIIVFSVRKKKRRNREQNS